MIEAVVSDLAMLAAALLVAGLAAISVVVRRLRREIERLKAEIQRGKDELQTAADSICDVTSPDDKHADAADLVRRVNAVAQQVQTALATTTDLLERTGAMAQVGGWQVDVPSMKLTWTSETFRIAEMSAAGPEPSLDEAFHLYAPAVRPQVAVAVQAGIDSAQPFDLELPWVGVEGTKKWVRVQGSPVFERGVVVKLVGTIQDLTVVKQAKDQLQSERNFSHAVLENAGALILVLDRAGCIRRFNRAAELLSGLSSEDVVGKTPWETVLPAEIADTVRREAFEGLAANPEMLSGVYVNEWQCRDGSRRLTEWNNTLVLDDAGQMDYMVALGVDVTERHRVQRQLERSVHEKVGLLNEVHHRVKNNLQVITSLLRLEASRSQQAETRTVLGEMQARIRSMALLHEALYRSGVFASVDLASYLRQLATQAVRAQAGAAMLRLSLDLQPLRMSMDQAAPFGLLLNELISNSLKHGFPAGRSGELRIELQPLGDGSPQWRLRVSDDGVGLGAAAEFAAACERSLGLQLVADLARQLGATFSIGPAPLAIFELVFLYDAASPEQTTSPAPLN